LGEVKSKGSGRKRRNMEGAEGVFGKGHSE
jgi:hypothetical protein